MAVKDFLSKTAKVLYNNLHIIVIFLFAIITLGLYSLSKYEPGQVQSMVGGRALEKEEEAVDAGLGHKDEGSYMPSKPLGTNEEYAKVTGMSTNTAGLSSSCATVPTLDPSELLPSDSNSEWAKLNPSGQGELGSVNLLKSGYHSQINTIATAPMRNSNLQVRSDPPVPKENVGPFLNSTIEPEQGRPCLEIGNASC
tara:strand:- start:1684 stop:2274 length:591 start_codon:yes stop_codon:yes gene_type:complete